jgi:hypothetical protein
MNGWLLRMTAAEEEEEVEAKEVAADHGRAASGWSEARAPGGRDEELVAW